MQPKGEEAKAEQETWERDGDGVVGCTRMRRVSCLPLTNVHSAHVPMIHLSRAAPCRSGRLNGLF